MTINYEDLFEMTYNVLYELKYYPSPVIMTLFFNI